MYCTTNRAAKRLCKFQRAITLWRNKNQDNPAYGIPGRKIGRVLLIEQAVVVDVLTGRRTFTLSGKTGTLTAETYFTGAPRTAVRRDP